MKDIFSVYKFSESPYESDFLIGCFPDQKSTEDFINKSDYNRNHYYWTKELLINYKGQFHLEEIK